MNKELYKKIKNRWKKPISKINICQNCLHCMNENILEGCKYYAGLDHCPGFKLQLRPLKTKKFSLSLFMRMIINTLYNK